MKKYLAIITGLLFVLGFAASAFAIHAQIPAETQAVVAKGSTQITIGGDIRFRGEFAKNLSDQLDEGSGNDDHVAYIDNRVRIKLDVKVTDATSGRIHIEHGGKWAKDGTDNAKGVYQVGNYVKTDSFDLVEAWIQHNFGPVGIKVGHMPLALGNKLFFDHRKEGDDAIVLFGKAGENVHWAVLTAKFRESDTGLNDDANAYVALVNYKGGSFNFGGDIAYVDDQSGSVGSATIGSAVHLWNLGLRGDINVAGITIRGDVELQTGKIKDSNGAVCTAGDDCDFKGYAFLLGADYKLGNTKISAEFGYGSGDDDSTDSDYETFVTSLSIVQYNTYVYGYRTADTALGNGAGQTGISNLMYFSLGASSKLSKDLSVKGAIYYLKAVEDVSINGGTADDDLGWEIDAKVTYNLDRNLKYWIEAGYFIVGDAYNNASDDSDNMYSFRHGIQLSF